MVSVTVTNWPLHRAYGTDAAGVAHWHPVLGRQATRCETQSKMLRKSSSDSESKQRFLGGRDLEWSTLGAFQNALKLQSFGTVSPVLFLKLVGKSAFDGLGMLREFLCQHELRCATTSKLVDQLIVQLDQRGFCEVSGW